jgi:hypothetical protein
MGLDQNAYRVNKNENNTDFSYEDLDEYGDEATVKLATWRKHPNLEGWMEKLFIQKADAQGYEGKTELNHLPSVRIIGQVNEFNKKLLDKALNNEEAAKEIELQNILAELANANKRRVFNCQPIRLTMSDLDQLEMHIKNNNLPDTQGFFFGDDSDDYYKAIDLKFIINARQAILDGYDVYYSSWW